MRRLPFLSYLAVPFLLTAAAYASDMSQATGEIYVQVIRLNDSQKIPGLSFANAPTSVETVNGVRTARFKGTSLNAKGGNMIYTIQGQMRVARISESDGSFEIVVPMTTATQIVRLRSIDDYGKIYDDAIRVRAEDSTEKTTGKKWNFDIGAGLSFLDYTETFRNLEFNVTEVGVTVKAGVNYIANKKWEIGGNTFVTAVPFALKTERVTTATNGTKTTANDISEARWFGVNGRVGYKLKQTGAGSWHLMSGWYIWGMIVPAASPTTTYGVQYLGGPQFFLTGRFQTRSKRAYATYLKFATIQDSGFLSATNRELAIGGAYQISKPGEGYRRWMLTADVAHAKFAKQNQSFSLLSASIGIGTNL